MTASATFTREGIWRGALKARPFIVSTFAYGIAFGLVALQARLSLLEATLMSAAIFSGSAQLAAIGILTSGSGTTLVWTLVATILVVNARYVLFGATLRPWLSQVSPLKAYGSLFFIVDGGWLLSMKEHEAGEKDVGFVFGSGLASFLAWLAGTLAGHLAGALAPDPALLGLDFLLIAFSAAMMTEMVRGIDDAPVIAVAMVVAVMVDKAVSFGAAVVAAGLAGGLVAALRHRREAP